MVYMHISIYLIYIYIYISSICGLHFYLFFNKGHFYIKMSSDEQIVSFLFYTFLVYQLIIDNGPRSIFSKESSPLFNWFLGALAAIKTGYEIQNREQIIMNF